MKKKLAWAAFLPIILFAGCTNTTQSQTDVENAKQEFASLKDAYDQLSLINGVTEDSISKIEWGKYEIKIEKNAGATHLDRQQIDSTGNAMLDILDRVPLKYIVNGATNQLAAGFVYANRLSADTNEVLIVAGSGEAGIISASYGIANDSTVYALRISELSMQGQRLKLTLESTPDQQINLINFYD